MKKHFLALTAFWLLLFIAPAGATTQWEVAGASFENTVWVNTGEIRPVTLPNGTPVPHIYRITTCVSETLDTSKSQTTLVDFQSGRFYIQGAPKGGKWEKNTAGSSGIFDAAHIYTHKAEIDQRTPYQLTKKEASFGKRNPDFQVKKNGWKGSFDNKQIGKGWIQTRSIQITTLENEPFPTIRFLAEMERKYQGKKMNLLLLLEINPNKPQQYRVLHVWGRSGREAWLPISNDAKAVSPLSLFSETAYLGTTAYEYLLTHAEEIKRRGEFTPGINEKEPSDWLKL
jgi:hypothetical protein